MKTNGFSAIVLFYSCLGVVPSFTWAGDFIPQTLGMYDTIYELRYGIDCRSCHGTDLGSPHHALGLGSCVICHTQDPSEVYNCLDCHYGHDPGGHHASDVAAAWQCIACHDPGLIDQYPSVPPSYPISYVTPRPYRCKACHKSSPNPPGPDDPDPPLVGIDGYSPATNTHHNTRGEVFNPNTCQNCHDHTVPHTDPLQIRYCERCHSASTLHSIAAHGEPHCGVCHTDTSEPSICECDLVPDNTMFARGGTLGFQASVTNNTGGMGTVMFGTKVTKPDASQTGFIWGPLQVYLNPHQTKSGHKTHSIPVGFELGTYTYHGYVGRYGNIYYECEFNFEVVP